MPEKMKRCKDFEKDGKWDTNLCCSYCHDKYAHGEEHEIHRETYQTAICAVCTPLFEQLFCGATHFSK